MCRLSSVKVSYQIPGYTTDVLPKIIKYRGALATIRGYGVGVQEFMYLFLERSKVS